MEINAKLKFRIKVEVDKLGNKKYYPQASYKLIGIIPIKRKWFGIGINLRNGEKFDLNKNYELYRQNMGFDNVSEAKRVIEIWKPKLLGVLNKKTKYKYYIKYKN